MTQGRVYYKFCLESRGCPPNEMKKNKHLKLIWKTPNGIGKKFLSGRGGNL